MPTDYANLPTYPLVHLHPAFLDARGGIQNLFTDGTQSGAWIWSKQGARRADHFHKTGDHLCVVISGRILYKWRKVGDTNPPKSITIESGQAFFTPPMVEHSMEMLTDTTFLAFDGTVAREPAIYDEDIVKLAEPLT